VVQPSDGLPRADLCVYVDRDEPHVPDRSAIRFAIGGHEVPFLGRPAHLAELRAPAADEPAFLLTIQASNEEVCQHANRDAWSPEIVLVIRDGCGGFGSNLLRACPNDLRRPLLRRPPKWWISDHRISSEGGPWELNRQY